MPSSTVRARGRVDPEGGISGEIGAQNDCVDEGADQRFKFHTVSTRQQRPDVDVVLAA